MTVPDGTARRGLDPASLAPLVRPRSLALVGASTDPGKIGGRPIGYLKKAGYRGRIVLVNPRAARIQGLPAVASVAAIGEPVDQAIIAVPAAAVDAAVDECLAAGVRALVLYSAGFAEVGADGRARQAALAARVRAAGARLLGPNTIGAFNVADGYYGTFATALESIWPTAGRVGIASQSGAFGTYCYALAADRGIGVSSFIATGNEADVDIAEAIAYLADDADTDVIMCALEGARDGDRLVAALARAAAAQKPVVAMKLGASEPGQRAAVSHTGALAGSAAVFDSVFTQYGVHRAATLEEMIDVVGAATHGARPANARVGIFTASGGIGIRLADAVVERGLDLAPMPAAAAARIKEILPYASGHNPVDTTAQILSDMSLMTRMFEITVAEGGYGTVIVFLSNIGHVPERFGQIDDALRDVKRRHPETVFVLCLRALPEIRDAMRDSGFLVVEDPDRAVAMVAGLRRLARGPAPTPVPAAAPEPVAGWPADGAPDEVEAGQLLAGAGIPMVAMRTADTADQAVAVAAALGYPVALKIRSRNVAHKTEIGGVRLDLATAPAVAAAFADIVAAAGAAAPDATIDGVVVAPMASGGVEAIIGAHTDPIFGPVVMFGLGGVLVELFDDVAFRVAPFDVATARAMIAETRGAALLAGWRGQPPADIDALAGALAALSRFAWANRATIASIDVNPLLVRADGVVGLDALIVPGPAAEAG